MAKIKFFIPQYGMPKYLKKGKYPSLLLAIRFIV
jgi:hypothetical protein